MYTKRRRAGARRRKHTETTGKSVGGDILRFIFPFYPSRVYRVIEGVIVFFSDTEPQAKRGERRVVIERRSLGAYQKPPGACHKTLTHATRECCVRL